MLSRLLKEHQAKQNERKDLQGELTASYRLAVMLTDAKNKAAFYVRGLSFPHLVDILTVCILFP